MDKIKIILSGGGTGGHIYPAVAVAEALQRRLGDGVELLFVGAEGKMEMEKIPALGYRIEGLPVAGLQRRLTARNLSLPFKVAASLRKARRVIRSFGADVVVGFGGYASAPVLWSAQRMGIPTLIQEQNSYAGVTNKLLASRARRICVAVSTPMWNRDPMIPPTSPMTPPSTIHFSSVTAYCPMWATRSFSRSMSRPSAFLQHLYILSVISFPAAPVNRRRCRPAKFLSS